MKRDRRRERKRGRKRERRRKRDGERKRGKERTIKFVGIRQRDNLYTTRFFRICVCTVTWRQAIEEWKKQKNFQGFLPSFFPA